MSGLDRLRNRRDWSLAGWIFATHVAVWLAVSAGLLLINLATGVPPFWFLFPLWGWGILIAAHAGFLIAPRGLLGPSIGIYVVTNLGLIVIDFVYSSTRWFYWPLLIWGIAVLIHIGAVVTLRLREEETTTVVEAAVPGTRQISETNRIIMGVLLSLSLIIAVTEVGTGAMNGLTTRGSGHAKTITRSLGSFSAITVQGQGKLFVEIGSPPSIAIRGDDNIVGRVETSISGSTLTIRLKSTWYHDINPKIDLEYHVTVPSLTAITLYDRTKAVLGDLRPGDLSLTSRDQSDLIIEQLTAPNLSLSARDQADVVIQGGTVNSTTIKADDNADVNLAGLVSQSVTVEARDNTDVFVLATHDFDAVANDNSEVRYVGSPTIKRKDAYNNSSILPAEP